MKVYLLCLIGILIGLTFWLTGTDFIIAKWLETNQSQNMVEIWKIVGWIGLGLMQAGGCALAGGWFWWNSNNLKAMLMVHAIWIPLFAGFLNLFIKAGIGRPRPKMFLWHNETAPVPFSLDASHWSFTSGHTVTSFALAAVLIQAFPKYKMLWFALATAVAVSRVGAVTTHYVSDVVAGAAIGYAVAIYLINRFKIVK